MKWLENVTDCYHKHCWPLLYTRGLITPYHTTYIQDGATKYKSQRLELLDQNHMQPTSHGTKKLVLLQNSSVSSCFNLQLDSIIILRVSKRYKLLTEENWQSAMMILSDCSEQLLLSWIVRQDTDGGLTMSTQITLHSVLLHTSHRVTPLTHHTGSRHSHITQGHTTNTSHRVTPLTHHTGSRHSHITQGNATHTSHRVTPLTHHTGSHAHLVLFYYRELVAMCSHFVTTLCAHVCGGGGYHSNHTHTLTFERNYFVSVLFFFLCNLFISDRSSGIAVVTTHIVE